jgi:hypothetical protein
MLQLVIGRHSRHLYLEEQSGTRTRLSFPEGHPAELVDASGRTAPIRRGGIEVAVRGSLAADGSLLAEQILVGGQSSIFDAERDRLSALASQHGEEDFLAVGWSKPGDTTVKAKEIIAGEYLSPIED